MHYNTSMAKSPPFDGNSLHTVFAFWRTRLHYWETTCLKDKVGNRDIVQRLWQSYSCSFLRTWPLMTSRDLEDSRWSWTCMVEMEQPLRQFSASSLHHDIMTATSEDASFPWFLVLSRRQCAREKQNTYAIHHSAVNWPAANAILLPPSVLYHACHGSLSAAISSMSSCSFASLHRVSNSASTASCSHGPFQCVWRF